MDPSAILFDLDASVGSLSESRKSATRNDAYFLSPAARSANVSALHEKLDNLQREHAVEFAALRQLLESAVARTATSAGGGTSPEQG